MAQGTYSTQSYTMIDRGVSKHGRDCWTALSPSMRELRGRCSNGSVGGAGFEESDSRPEVALQILNRCVEEERIGS